MTFLESVEHIHSTFKFDCIDCTISISPVVLNYFEDAWPKALPRFGSWMLPAKLGHAESGSNIVLHRFGKANRSSLLEPIQKSGLSPGTRFALVIEYPSSGIYKSSPMKIHCAPRERAVIKT